MTDDVCDVCEQYTAADDMCILTQLLRLSLYHIIIALDLGSLFGISIGGSLVIILLQTNYPFSEHLGQVGMDLVQHCRTGILGCHFVVLELGLGRRSTRILQYHEARHCRCHGMV